MDENHSLNQKKIAFAQSDHVEAALLILRECVSGGKLVEDTEFKTLVNAVTLDAHSNMMEKFINSIDFIKKGGLVSTEL